jgi:hypothetical protein
VHTTVAYEGTKGDARGRDSLLTDESQDVDSHCRAATPAVLSCEVPRLPYVDPSLPEVAGEAGLTARRMSMYMER